MRLVILLLVMIAAVSSLERPMVHHGIAAAGQEGSIGGIIVGLILCAPLFGLFALIGVFQRWHRNLHRRMSTRGIR